MNKLYVVGIGPGAYEDMTVRAVKTLEDCQVIAGYTVYVDLVRKYFPEKEFLTTPMRQETARCRMALEKACEGKTVAMVCSGDAGVYGMAGVLLELCADYPKIQVEVVPGVTAAVSGAAILGAPLMHDFAVISLSDLMTPWELIEKRLRAAAAADFAICIYNPSSKKRADYLKRACEIMLEYREGSNLCGIVNRIGREGMSSNICTLEELCSMQTDMFTTVFIGNSVTKTVKEKLVTPRGYDLSKK
ncbi:MAG: precorrin-3B C(17)-methyltransferase [Lachnospiraceae bacterium]|nr:precorrin-3B C(17)-methyltransferase [Lachnospiraceae bacterium]